RDELAASGASSSVAGSDMRLRLLCANAPTARTSRRSRGWWCRNDAAERRWFCASLLFPRRARSRPPHLWPPFLAALGLLQQHLHAIQFRRAVPCTLEQFACGVVGVGGRGACAARILLLVVSHFRLSARVEWAAAKSRAAAEVRVGNRVHVATHC